MSLISNISYAEAPNYRRHIIQENGESVYVVTSRAPHLFMISRDLYGEAISWKAIAKWNDLKAPYNLSLGQHLVLKRPPILSAEQGDRLLMRSWSNMKRPDIVAGIQGAGSGTAPASVTESTTSVKAEATATANAHSEIVITSRAAGVDDKATAEVAPTPAPVVKEVQTLVAEKTGTTEVAKPATPALPTPAPVVVAPTTAHEEKVAAAPTPAPVPVVAPVAAPVAASAHAETTATSKTPLHSLKPSPWTFQVAAAASAFRLESKNTASSVSNTLNSDIDYGIELEASHPLAPEIDIFFQALIEHMDIRPSEGLEIGGESQYMMRFAIGIERELSDHSSIHAAIAYEQLPFVTPTPTGVDVEAIYIPQITAGAQLGLLNRGSFTSWFTLDGILLLPRSQDDHDVKSGEGFSVGLKFQNKLSSDFLTYGVAYRYIQQNTSDSENNQKAILGNLGVRF